jgi:hypothetical protein
MKAKLIRIVNGHTGQVKFVGESVVASGALDVHGWRVEEIPSIPKELIKPVEEELTNMAEANLPNEEISFEEMSVAALRSYAKENNIALPRNASKQVIINTINNHGN